MTLPEWTRSLIPVDMDGAALLLGVSRRFLVDAIKVHSHYERRGVKKLFYPEHIAQLREALSCQDSTSKTIKATEFGMPLALSVESEYEKALARATAKSRKNSKRNMKRANGNVIPMARKP